MNQYVGVLAPHLPQGADRTSSGSSARCRCRSCLDSGSSICTAVAPDAVFTVRTHDTESLWTRLQRAARLSDRQSCHRSQTQLALLPPWSKRASKATSLGPFGDSRNERRFIA